MNRMVTAEHISSTFSRRSNGHKRRNDMSATVGKYEKDGPPLPSNPEGAYGKTARFPAKDTVVTSHSGNGLTGLMATSDEIQRIRLSIHRELELAKHIRAEADKYRQETEARARSQAQMLILQARLTIKKEIEEMKRLTTEEIQQILADMRMIRITAQEELGAQRKFTDAARIRALSMAIQEPAEETGEEEKAEEIEEEVSV